MSQKRAMLLKRGFPMSQKGCPQCSKNTLSLIPQKGEIPIFTPRGFPPMPPKEVSPMLPKIYPNCHQRRFPQCPQIRFPRCHQRRSPKCPLLYCASLTRIAPVRRACGLRVLCREHNDRDKESKEFSLIYSILGSNGWN